MATAMLKLHEKGIPNKAETPDVLAIREGRIQKDKKKPQGVKGKDKGKNKLAYAPKPKISSPSKRDNSAKDSICHHCKEVFVVPISRLVDNSYIHTFTNYVNSVSKDNVFYFNAIPHDGIYEIDMHNIYPNDSSTYNVSNKRAKHVLDSEYLWHCRLGHINKKRMEKLQRDGILQPHTYDESLDKCKSCIFGKMARKPFPYKVFQNEVENQLGKKIKAIQSNQGGGYLSHEFVNHIKSCVIVCQVTPPYTPQHNRVSERRNQTLLDMVRSMMNLTTLPKYFWVYALESAARILNMVPTKKFERTLYEIWHGKAPKLSYLRVWGRVALETMGYYFYNPLENKIFVARNAEFFENSLTFTRSEWESRITRSESERISQAPDRYGFYVDAEENKLGDLDEPPNYKAALSDPESDKWFDVIGNEYSRKGAKRKPKTNKSKHGKERTKSSRTHKESVLKPVFQSTNLPVRSASSVNHPILYKPDNPRIVTMADKSTMRICSESTHQDNITRVVSRPAAANFQPSYIWLSTSMAPQSIRLSGFPPIQNPHANSQNNFNRGNNFNQNRGNNFNQVQIYRPPVNQPVAHQGPAPQTRGVQKQILKRYVTANDGSVEKHAKPSLLLPVLEPSSCTEDVQPPVVQIQSRNPNPEPNVAPVSPIVAPVVTPIPKASISISHPRRNE
ncbi:retrotransposon protein, putative, ty1-copia subclass [Tanacetum coccineum]